MQKNKLNVSPIVVAEVGVNHNGNMKLAKKLIAEAAKSGADYVKFQTYNTKSLVSKNSSSAQYQKKYLKKKENQFLMLKKYELSYRNHLELIKECKKKKIKFLSSPFDIESINMLVKLNLNLIKVPSGEINNIPYLKRLGSFKKKIILSTGMSNLKEIITAIKILIKSGTPKSYISVLHCTSEYPTELKNANLKSISFLKKKLGCKIGYSDHTIGSLASICAVILGAEIIEKHITLSNNMKGPDHQASLNVKKLYFFVNQLKSINSLYGSKFKKITDVEKKNSIHIRKSIFAKKKIYKGEIFSSKNVIPLRPEKFLSVSNWNKVIGKKSNYNFSAGKPIKLK